MEEDRISELPDGIIAIIISRLTLKQAVATSSISTRWTDLWKFYSGFFDFDGSDAVNFSDSDGENEFDFEGSKSRGFDNWFRHLYRSHHGTTIEQYGSIISKKRNFVDRINRVLRSHQGTTIERLRIFLNIRDSSPEIIDSWVQLALAKRVQFIDLDLEWFESNSPIKHPIEYEFPIRSHCSSRSLKSLILNNIDISGNALESIVDKCPNLEDLSITGSFSIEVFKLYSLSLKQFTLWCCHPFVDVKISAPNLLSFAWPGLKHSNLVLQDVPQLKYVRISDYSYHIQSHYSQLVTLELDDRLDRQDQWNINLPELSNLRHLTMKRYFFNGDQTFRFIVAYLKAAPSLEKFTLEVYAHRGDGKLSEAALNMAMNHCYKNLKSVEFKGFGATQDVEFIRYLRNHAPLLEKIVIDLCPPYLGSPAETEHRLAIEYLEARNRAINFGASLDCHVTVV